MLQILRSYGITKKIVSAIGLLHNNNKSSVLFGDSVSKSFDVSIGACTSRRHFGTLPICNRLDWVMRQTTVDNPGFVVIPRQSRRQPEYNLSDLDYADDIAMLLSSIKDAQKFTRKTCLSCFRC